MMTESKGPLLFSKQWVTPARRDASMTRFEAAHTAQLLF